MYEAQTQVRDQKEGMMVVAKAVCGLLAHKNISMQYTYIHLFFHVPV